MSDWNDRDFYQNSRGHEQRESLSQEPPKATESVAQAILGIFNLPVECWYAISQILHGPRDPHQG